MHLHLRDGKLLPFTLRHSASAFARAIIMPNLHPPVDNLDRLAAYHREILSGLRKLSLSFTPLMTLYLTEKTSASLIREATRQKILTAVKLYPHGTTTRSLSGLRTLEQILPLAEMLEKYDVPLLMHGEDPSKGLDIFDRERFFMERYAAPLARKFPHLRMVIEHVSSQEGVDFVKAQGARVAATVTIQHLLYTRNVLFRQGLLRPHFFCLPILKKEKDLQAIQKVVLEGNPKFFLGTDSAPHLRHHKENACGCAGIFSGSVALECYAEFFDQNDAIDKLENFASRFGADFYRLPTNQQTLKLVKKPLQIAQEIVTPEGSLVPFRAGEICQWQICSDKNIA